MLLSVRDRFKQPVWLLCSVQDQCWDMMTKPASFFSRFVWRQTKAECGKWLIRATSGKQEVGGVVSVRGVILRNMVALETLVVFDNFDIIFPLWRVTQAKLAHTLVSTTFCFRHILGDAKHWGFGALLKGTFQMSKRKREDKKYMFLSFCLSPFT